MNVVECCSNLSYVTLADTLHHVVGYCNISPSSTFHIHYHKTMELYYILKGNGSIYVRDRWVKAEPNSYYYFPAYTNHCCRADSEEGLQFIYLFMKGPFKMIEYFK